MGDLPVGRIQIPLPESFGALAPVNAYLIDATPLTLIDAGINSDDARRALAQGLADAGHALGDVERVLITHAHPDHYGLATLLRDEGATIFFPVREKERVANRNLKFEVGRLLLEAGMPMDLLVEMDEKRRGEPRPPRLDDDFIEVHDGDRFDFDDVDFYLEARFMPGHTGGHVVYFDPESRTLFAGDQLLPEVSPNPLLEPSLDDPGERRASLVEYLASLDAMADMEPTLVYPGHGDPVDDPAKLITRTIEHHHARKDELRGRLDADGKTPYEIAQEVFSNLRGYDSFLAVSEVVAHLDLLVADDSAKFERRCGVTVYRLAT